MGKEFEAWLLDDTQKVFKNMVNGKPGEEVEFTLTDDQKWSDRIGTEGTWKIDEGKLCISVADAADKTATFEWEFQRKDQWVCVNENFPFRGSTIYKVYPPEAETFFVTGGDPDENKDAAGVAAAEAK